MELDLVYLRMDRFRDCERILDRQAFRTEYVKEMDRKTRLRPRKN